MRNRIAIRVVLTAALLPLGRAGEKVDGWVKLEPIHLRHYAQSAPIRFTGRTIEGHEAAIREYLVRKYPDLVLTTPEGKLLLTGMALMVKGTEHGSPVLVGKYYNQVVDAYNAYPKIAEAIARTSTPAQFKEILGTHYASLMIKRGLRVDVDEICGTLADIPGSSHLVAVKEGESVAGHLAQAFPGYERLSPAAKKGVLDYLARINPHIRPSGWYRAEGPVEEPWEHVAVPVKGKGLHVCLYQVAGNARVLIPPPAALQNIAARIAELPHSVDGKWDVLAGATIERPGINDGALVDIAFADDGRATLCDYTVLTVRLSEEGEVVYAYATTPSLNGLTHAVDVTGLKNEGGKLTGSVTASVRLADGGPPVPCRYVLDGAISGAAVTGTFTSRYESTGPDGKGAPRAIEVAGRIEGRLRKRADAVTGRMKLARDGGFPCWRGQYGNGSAAPPDSALVDSSASIRLAWRSADPVPDSKPSWPIRGGGFASPVISRGRAYVYYYVPSGPFYNEAAIEHATRSAAGRGTAAAVDREQWKVDADDVIHCIDAETGWTLWRTSFNGKGVSYRAIGGGSEKSGAHFTMAVSSGPGRDMCYALATAGRVYAMDGATGEPVWESSIGERAEAFECFRAHARKTKTRVPLNRDLCSCPVVAGGVVACNNHVEYQGGQRLIKNGLVGLDAATGKRLWDVPNCVGWFGTPVRWVHKGNEYFISVGSRAVCIEPRTGNVLWEIPGARHDNAPAVVEDYLVCNASAGAGVTAYRITPHGAEKAWSLGSGQTGGLCGTLILDGHVYAQVKGGTGELLVCVELESGKVVGTAAVGGGLCSSLVGSGGRILREWGTKRMEGLIMLNADPKRLGRLGPPFPVSYANSVTPAIADGRMFVRGRDGLYCYDLREDRATSNSDAATELVMGLRSEDRRLMRCVVSGLQRMGTRAAPAVPALTAILKSGDTSLWDPVASALMAAGPAGQSAAVTALAEAIVSPKSPAAPAIAILSEIGPGAVEEETKQVAIRAAIGVLGSKSIDMQISAAECLGGFGPDAKEAVPALERAYLETPLREAARAALESIRPGVPVQVRPEMDPANAEEPLLDLE